MPSPIATDSVRFRSLFDHSPELILYQNQEGTILDANPAFLRVVELSREQVLHTCYHDLLSPHARPLFKQKLAEAFTGRTVRFEMHTAQGQSAPRYWDVVKVPLVEQGEVVGVHMLARDISEKMLSQEQIFAQNRDLQQFTYIVSHNLRAPLANAMGLVRLLDTEEPGSPYFQQARTHLSESLHQLDLVLQDINSILAVRDKQGLTPPEVVSVHEVVEQVAHNLQEDLAQIGGTLQLEIPPQVWVQANRGYLYSIFFNLLTNALKYRSPQRPLRVTLTGQGGPGQPTTITVADNGLGFPPEAAQLNVFELYQRFHPTHSGRGVGLYLVKAHVESMGGQISVHSQPEEGARFTITLPELAHADDAR